MNATLPCTGCAVPVPEEARFCGACGAKQPDESAADVARYSEALAALGGRTESWAVAELGALRVELRIRQATHDRLAAPKAEARAPVGLEVDAQTLGELRLGEQGLLRLRVRNDGPRAVRVAISGTTTADGERLAAETRGVLGPGEDEVLGLVLRPGVAGAHTASLELAVRGLVGEGTRHHAGLEFKVGAAGALQQSIHIDARNQKVGIFENIGGASKGGLVGHGQWRELALRAGPAPAATPRSEPSPLPAVGSRGVGVVEVAGDPPVVGFSGARGAVVDLDPALRGVLAAGDRLEVTVLGHDGRGGLVLATRAAGPAAAAKGADVRVGPGESLREALAAALDGARIVVSGVHTGPFSVAKAIELTGDGILEAPRGPVLVLAGDIVVRGLTVRGAAPPGGYAADAVEIRAGRVALDGCTLSADADGNLVPGRAVALAGRATVELRGCRLTRSGLGVAIDVSWSGFPTDTAAGARVTVTDCAFDGVGTGVAAAGAQRSVTVTRSDLAGCRERGVHVSKGASATVEDCRLASPKALASDGGVLTARGNR